MLTKLCLKIINHINVKLIVIILVIGILFRKLFSVNNIENSKLMLLKYRNNLHVLASLSGSSIKH